MKTKVFILLTALSFGAPILFSSNVHAHNGSKTFCVLDASNKPDGCKHNKMEKKKNNSRCHLHDYDIDGWSGNKFHGILGISGGNCKKT